jgi:hypothetical protein
MELETALSYLKRNTACDAVMFFEVLVDLEGDLDKVCDAAQAIGWHPEINRAALSVRVFRPRPTADSNSRSN